MKWKGRTKAMILLFCNLSQHARFYDKSYFNLNVALMFLSQQLTFIHSGHTHTHTNNIFLQCIIWCCHRGNIFMSMERDSIKLCVNSTGVYIQIWMHWYQNPYKVVALYAYFICMWFWSCCFTHSESYSFWEMGCHNPF